METIDEEIQKLYNESNGSMQVNCSAPPKVEKIVDEAVNNDKYKIDFNTKSKMFYTLSIKHIRQQGYKPQKILKEAQQK